MEYPRQRVFDSLLEAETKARYYGYLAGRLQRQEKLLTLCATILSSGAFVAFVAKSDWLPSALVPAFAVLSAIASGVLAAHKPGKKAALCGERHKRWTSASRDLEVLWLTRSRVTPEEATERWRAIDEKYTEADDVATVEIPLHRRLVDRCQAEVKHYRRLTPATA